MKKKSLLIFLCLCIYNGWAQMPSIFSEDVSILSKTRMGLTSDFFVSSNSVTPAFIDKFYTGGYIDVKLKDQVLKLTQNENRIGAELNYGLFVSVKPDSLFHRNVFHLFFSLRDRQHADASFSKDFYKIGFYGNASYAGNTATLGNFSFNLIRYQQLQIGLFSSKLDSAARWGIGLSFLKGEHYSSVLARKADLYTSPDGKEINFDTDIEIAQSNPLNKGLNATNGYGASLDIYFEAPFQSKIGNSKLVISVADIGLIRFDDQSLYRRQDSLFHYNGFYISSITDIRDSTFLPTSKDSIINTIFPAKKRAVTVTLPSTLNLSFETAFNKHFHLMEGARYLYNANNKLYVYLKGNIYFTKKVMLSVIAGYGSYGNINYGLGIAANLGAGFLLYAGSNNLEGYLLPSMAGGRSAYFSLFKNFN